MVTLFKISDENDLRHLLFEDILPIVTSDTGKVVGEYQLQVSLGGGKRHPMLTVKANSVGSIDSVPCGTSITARLTPQLETLEQRVHEYVKVKSQIYFDSATQLIKCNLCTTVVSHWKSMTYEKDYK